MPETPNWDGGVEDILQGTISIRRKEHIEVEDLAYLMAKDQGSVVKNLARVHKSATLKVVVEDWGRAHAPGEGNG